MAFCSRQECVPWPCRGRNPPPRSLRSCPACNYGRGRTASRKRACLGRSTGNPGLNNSFTRGLG
eukprot:273510-Alexandrium_andersonii.AAC.1